MKTTHLLLCLVLLTADIAMPLAGATHTTEAEVPLGDPPQVGKGPIVGTEVMPVNQAQEDLMELVGPPANEALVAAYDAYHAGRTELEELSSRGLIRPYKDGMGQDTRDGASELDPDVRMGGFGEWRVIGDHSWTVQKEAAQTGVAGYSSATLPDGTYRSNVKSLLISPELDLRTGMDPATGSAPGTAVSLGKGHVYATGQPKDAPYEFSFAARYNLAFKIDSVNVLVFTSVPTGVEEWSQGKANEDEYEYPNLNGVPPVGIPGSRASGCATDGPICWEFVEPMEAPYVETNKGYPAFSGAGADGEWEIYHIDLSKWAEQSIWIGFSFISSGTPIGYFENEQLFNRELPFYGFQLDDAQLEMPGHPHSLRLREPNLPTAQIPSPQTGLDTSLLTVPADTSSPVTFDVVNMGLEEAVVEATIRLYEGLGPTEGKTSLESNVLNPVSIPPGRVARFVYDLPPLPNPSITGTKHTIEVGVQANQTSPVDPDPDDQIARVGFNVITFEDVFAGDLTQTSTFAGFGESVVFELPVHNLGNTEVTVEADACGIDLLQSPLRCSDGLFSHGEGTKKTAVLAPGTEHTFQWIAKGSVAGQHRIFVRASTDLDSVAGFATDLLRTDLTTPLRSRYVDTIVLDGRTAEEEVWLQAPSRTLPGDGTLSILNSDSHIFLAIKSRFDIRLLLDDLADHRAVRAHDGGVLANVDGPWFDLELMPDGLSWSSTGEAAVSTVAYDAEEGQYEIAVPIDVVTPAEGTFAGLRASLGDFIGLMLDQLGGGETGPIASYPKNARSSDGAPQNGALTDELYLWQPVRLGAPDDVVSEDTVRRFEFRGLSAGLGIERSPPTTMQEDFQQCPDMGQWVQENVKANAGKTEKWNCSSYGPDRRLVLYEGLSPDSACGQSACPPYSILGVPHLDVHDHSAATWKDSYDSGIIYTPPFKIDSTRPHLFLQHQYATESWIVDVPGFAGDATDANNHYLLGTEDPNVRTIPGVGAADRVQPMLNIMSAGRIYLQVWDEEEHGWKDRIFLRPEGGYTTDKTVGVVDPRLDEQRHIQLSQVNSEKHITTDAEGIGFWWPTGFQPLYRPLDQEVATGAEFQGSPWSFDRFPLFGTHMPFQESVSPQADPEGPVGLDLFGETVRLVFDFQRSQGDPRRDHGWRIGGIAVGDGERFQRDLSVDDVQIGPLLYDPKEIGVGPGSDVPVVVTLSNQGNSDLPGIGISLLGSDPKDPDDAICTWNEQFSTSIAVGESRQFEVPCSIPKDREGDLLLLQVEAAPLTGDDFLPNNRRNARDLFEVRPTPDVAVQVAAEPNVASRDVTRTMTVVVENRGNVPVSDFEVELQLRQVLGADASEVLGNAGKWRVVGELPINSRWRLDDPRLETETAVERKQLSFKPPEQGTFEAVARVVLDGDADRTNDVAAASMRARSLLYQDTFDQPPFKDEGTVTGERSSSGTEDVWSVTGGSHDGSRRLLAGDPLTGEIPANASSSIILPDLELTTVKGATMTLRHRYALEEGFDGARLEITADNGTTWLPLAPEPQPLGDLPEGHPSITMLGVNPLLGGEAEATAIAFTGNSASLNASHADAFGRRTGWISSEFDLSNHPELQRRTVIDSFDLHGFAKQPAGAPEVTLSGENQFRHASWTLDEPAAEGNQRYWWIQDATYDVRPHSGSRAWWSGSAGTEAEGLSDVHTILTYDFAVPEAGDDRRVFLSWWEYRAGNGDTKDRRGTGGDFSVQVGPLDEDLAEYAANGPTDLDGDFLDDETERLAYGTDPTAWDSDGDGLADNQESEGGGDFFHTDAHQACDPRYDTTHLPRCDRGYGTNANNPNSDNDEWPDGAEVHAGTDPTDAQSFPVDDDGDGLPDAWEEEHFGDLQENGEGDWDVDGVSNLDELKFGSDPTNPDADFDGIGDGKEIEFGLNPYVSNLPESEATIIQEDEGWVKREVEVTNYAGMDAFLRLEYLSIAGSDPLNKTRYQNNLGWLLDDLEITSYEVDAATRQRSHPQSHHRDDMEGPEAPEWTVQQPGWHRTETVPARGTVWEVEQENVPGKGIVPVWRFGDDSDQGYPHSVDARLVTPLVDLTTAVGDEAFFSFTHAYGFEGKNACRTPQCNTEDTFLSALDGGVIEVQLFNETKGDFDSWVQIGKNFREYPEIRFESYTEGANEGPLPPNFLSPISGRIEDSGYPAIEEKGLIISNTYFGNGCANDFYVDGNDILRGGGSAFEVQKGMVRWEIDPCSDSVALDKRYINWRDYGYSFVFSGDSDGWEEVKWDISPLIGKRVRFAFHAVTNPSLEGCVKDLKQMPCTGWNISDVAIEGNLFQGKPVQARLHLATDGSLTKGEWSLDDLELVGDRYKDNVAVLSDSETDVRAAHGEEVVFAGHVANIGINQRGALAMAVQALDADKRPYDVTVEFPAGSPDKVPEVLLPAGTHQAYGPFSLSPGGQESSTLPFRVHVTLPDGDDRITLRVQVLQANGEPVEVDGRTEFLYTRPTNEVSGNTASIWIAESRTVTDLRAIPDPTGSAVTIEPGAPRINEQVRLSNQVKNRGTTSPDVVARWSVFEVASKGDPATQPNVGEEKSILILRTEYPLGTLDRNEAMSTHQNFTPSEPGLYRALVEYTAGGTVHATAQWEFLVDTPANYYHVDFSTDGLAEWTDDSPVEDDAHGGSPDPIRFRHDGTSLVWGVDAGQLAAEKNYCKFGSDPCNVAGCPSSCASSGRSDRYVGLEGIGESPHINLRRVPQGQAVVTLTHSMGFSDNDGARLEAIPYRPETTGGLPEPAILCRGQPAAFVVKPTDGEYGMLARSAERRTESPPPMSPPTSRPYEVPMRFHPFAIAGDGSTPINGALMMGGSHSYETTRFDFSEQATAADPTCPTKTLDLMNYTVVLRLHTGQFPGYRTDYGSLVREGSQGWQIHSVSVSSIAVDIQPENRRFPVLDGAPKSFGFNIHNVGQVQETFHIRLDDNSSTLPDTSWVRLSADTVTIPPGDTRTIPFEVNIPPDPNLSRGGYTARLEARSASSPSIVDSIDVTLDLQSNPLPDLSASLSTDDGGQTITQGSISPVYVTVRNLGQVDSKSVRVHLFAAGEDGTEAPIDTLSLKALCPQSACGGGSRQTLAADWLVPELTGNYTLTARVDLDGRLLEERRDNNVASLLVKVVPVAVPDLAVTALQVEGVAADGFAEEGDLLVYRATVENLGLADARNVQVQILADSALLAEETLPVLAAGQSREVTAFKVGSRGETIALVHILPDDAELNTDNNQYKQSVRVRGHDLGASLVPARPLLEPGTIATVLLNVSNDGNAVERLEVSLEDAPGWSVSITPDPLFVAPGRNGTASLRISVPEDAVAGTPDLRLVIAPATNAGAAFVLSAPFDVKAVGGAPELEQNGTLSAQPGPVVVPLNVTSTTNTVQRVTLRLASPDWAHEPVAMSLQPLGQTPQDLSVVVPTGTEVGNHSLQVEAVGEDGTVLSQAVATMEVLEQRRVETAWSDVRTDGRADVGNQSYLVTLHARNTGNVPVALTLVPTDLAQNISAQTLVGDAIEPGAVQRLVLRVDAESDALAPLFGNVQVWMRAADTEGRGTLVRTLALPDPTDAPDLHVVRLDISPRAPSAGETVRVSAVVENQGALLSNDSRLHIYLDGALLEDLEVPTVAPGETAAVNATWTVRRGGTFHLIALADAEGNVSETEEANNGLSQTLEVEDKAYMPGFVERNVPSLPLLPLLLAVAAVGAALRRRRSA